MKENEIKENGNIKNEESLNENSSFSKLQILQKLIKKESSLKELCKHTYKISNIL